MGKVITAIFALAALSLSLSLEAAAQQTSTQQVTILRDKHGGYNGKVVRQGSTLLYYDKSGYLFAKNVLQGNSVKRYSYTTDDQYNSSNAGANPNVRLSNRYRFTE